MKFKLSNLFWPRFWKNLWYEQISSRIWPRQRWLTKKIPRTWADKDTLIEITLIECLRNYVEGEKGLDYFAETKEKSPFLMGLSDHYYLVNFKLPDLEAELERAWEKVPHFDFSDINNQKIDYQTTYGEVDRLEKEIDLLKTKICLWVVNWRGSMWT